MKGGAQLALAVAGGYLLGRSRKMRWLLLLGAAASGKALNARPDLVKQGMKTLGASPEVSKLTGDVGGRLVEAGKAAAVTAASNQIEAVSDALHERAESLQTPEGTDQAAESNESEDEAATEDQQTSEEGAPDDEERASRGEQKPAARRRSTQASSGTRSKASSSSSSRNGSRTGGASSSQSTRKATRSKSAQRTSAKKGAD